MISISIDLRLIDQSRCKKVTRRDGTAATFCELVLFETPNSEYGDYAVKQSVTKEEREAGVQLPFLGNGKSIAKGHTQAKPVAKPASKPPADPDLDAADDDDLPF